MTIHRKKAVRPPWKKRRASATGAAQQKRVAWGDDWGKVSHEIAQQRRAERTTA